MQNGMGAIVADMSLAIPFLFYSTISTYQLGECVQVADRRRRQAHEPIEREVELAQCGQGVQLGNVADQYVAADEGTHQWIK
jgi:hypothetical protein